ncbi:hypothetical protein [Fibrobacter sp. UWB11]|nr:hypothetical protein [Fibrobacter sp. UWB11]SHK98845.1 hypothetical protein SAMN05720759_11159 [Fibrobacter sp. UWB12]SIO41622.1 hypothetical protein SAMN05720758_2809 [Fibrobacter sp. UWB11]
MVTSVLAQDQWLNFSSPYPVKAAIPSGEGLLMATGGGIRYRANNADDLYTTSNGLGDQAMSAIAVSDLGVFAVSDVGVISTMLPGGSWQVLSRSYAGSNTHVVPGMALLGGPVLVIAFEDRLSFFSLKTMTSILTVERIADISVSAFTVSAMDIRGDSLIVAAGGGIYMRKMDWENLDSDVQLYNPDSWKIIKSASSSNEPIKSIAWKDGKIQTFATEGMRIWDKDGETRVALDTFSVFTETESMVSVRGKVLKDSILYERDSVEIKGPDGKKAHRYYYRSRVRWVSLQPKGVAVLGGPEIILYYDNGKFTDLTEYKPFPLRYTYELQALPQGGVLAATEDGYLSYYYFSGKDKNFRWTDPKPAYSVFRNGTDARVHNLKTLSVLPTGGTFYHIWGLGYLLYSGWAETLAESYSFANKEKDYCMDDFTEETSKSGFTIAVSTTPAPNNMGYLTTSASNKGYSLIYVELGENGNPMSCASNVGSAPIGGPMFARIDENGNWVVYVGTRASTTTDANGGLDVFTFPPPNKMGGDISRVDTTYRKTYSGESISTPLDLVYEPKTDNVWMVTTSSLVYWDKDENDLKTPLSTNGLSGAVYTSLDVDSRGNLWVGTSSQGAYRLTPRPTSPDTLSVLHFTSRHGLLSEKIQDVAVDTVLGMVWFAHDNGITRYKRDDVRSTENNMTDDAREDVKVYPNPFRPKLQPYVSFANVADDAIVSVYNRGGKLVVSLSGNQISGGRAEWNGRMENGSIVAPGVYQYVVRGGTKVRKGKLLIIH